MTQQYLLNNLKEREYRREFLSEQVKTILAAQIRMLREERGWSQEELARRSGTAQEMISKWENPDYGKYTNSTLLKLADAFEVAVITKFATFSELTAWLASLSKEQLAPKTLDEDRRTATLTAPVEGATNASWFPNQIEWENPLGAAVGRLQNIGTSTVQLNADYVRPQKASRERELTLASDKLSLAA